MHRIFIISLVLAVLLGYMSCAAAAMSSGDPLSRANSYLEQGQYFLALQETNKVLKEASSKQIQSRAYGMQGNIQLLMHRYDDAEKALLQASDLAQEPQQKAGYANSLGVLYHDTGKAARGDQYFKSALKLAGNNASLVLKIKLNRMRNQPDTEALAQAGKLLAEISAITSPAERAKYYVNFAAAVKERGQKGLDIAQSALEKAQADSGKIDDKRLLVELFDSLAEIYEIKGQDQRALELSEQASALTDQMDPDEVTISLEWRKGRIYQNQGKDDYALAAFGKAVDNIQAIRVDIPVEYHDGKSSFRETLEPVYLGYANHLLKKAGRQEGEVKQRTLLLARQTVEQIKQTELEDFFGGRCLIESLRRSELETMDTHAAVLYPIILPDRLEILVSIGKTTRQYTTPVPQNRVIAAATQLSDNLRKGAKAYQKPAQDLYTWIMAPIEKDLAAEEIKTLVVVPDGVLRLVPFSALFNGQQYVLEKYAVSVSPGMSLMGGGDEKSRTYHSLLAGLSRPGPVVEKLPPALISAILEPESEDTNERKLFGKRGLLSKHLRNIDVNAQRELVPNVERMLRIPGATEKLQQELSLPGVESELSNLKKTIKNTTLLNEQFTVESFHRQVSSESYEMIHIASHGIFSSDANNSFLMAYDNLLKLDDLETLLKGDQGAQQGIELLTLSACETAEGDDRAPLGFTGAALKANARSALGSLWPISDEAASQLMANFYKNLTQHLGKAEALRQAQLELLHSAKMNHPFYWSPFILVGNWL